MISFTLRIHLTPQPQALNAQSLPTVSLINSFAFSVDSPVILSRYFLLLLSGKPLGTWVSITAVTVYGSMWLCVCVCIDAQVGGWGGGVGMTVPLRSVKELICQNG